MGSSSFAGAVFDMLASKYLKSPHFRKLYASVFLLSISFLLLLYFASTIWIFMIAMALWGIYWDIYHFANFDFVSRAVPKKENTSAFGILGIFHSLGILIAPVIAGLVIETTVGAKPFLISGIMLFLSLVVFVGLYLQSIKNREIKNLPIPKMRSWNFEYRIWRIIGKQLMTVLLLTFLIYITDSFFWTIGPLIAENGEFGKFGGFLMMAYSFPMLIIGWFVGKISGRFGKKRTALYAFLIGSCVLSFFTFAQNPIHMILIVGLSSSFIGLSYPSLNGAYADYISETQSYEKEIQGSIDIFYNLGWMLGPMLAGLLAQVFGNSQSFSILGVFSVLTCVILIFKMPKKINLVVK